MGIGLEVLDEALLIRLVIVRCHVQKRIRTHRLRSLRQGNTMRRIVTAGTGDNRDTPACQFDGLLNQFDMLLIGHGRGFTRRAGDDEG